MSVRASAARARGPECTMECTCARRGDRSHRSARTGIGSVHRFADVRSLERARSGSLGCCAHGAPGASFRKNNRTNKPQHGRLNMAVGGGGVS